MVSDCLAVRENNKPPRLVFDINGHGISPRQANSAYREAIDQGNIIHADGGFPGTISAIRHGPKTPGRSATTDMIHEAAEAAPRKGLRFALLGGESGLTDRAADRLQRAYPDLKLVSCVYSFFKPEEEKAMPARIHASRADVIWTGFGKPIEQLFCVRNRGRLRAGWRITCDGFFSFITGYSRCVPLWVQNLGLEWLRRMASAPRSLIMRYLVTSPHALNLAPTR